MSAGQGWIEVGRKDCSECGGTGIAWPGYEHIDGWNTVSDLKRQYGECRSCDGSGTRSVGYSDLRDASGR